MQTREPHSSHSRWGITVIFSLVVVVVLIDTSLISLFDFVSSLTSAPGVTTFIFLLGLYFVGQQFFVIKVIARTHVIKESRLLSLVKILFLINQYVILAFLLLIAFQILTEGIYSLILFKAVFWITYLTYFLLMAILSQRFIVWSKSSKDYVVLAYTLAVAALGINALVTLIYVDSEQTGARALETIKPKQNLVSIFFTTNTDLYLVYFITSIFSFVMTWAASVILLRGYSTNKGRIRFWILVSIPLFYFLGQFQEVIVINILKLEFIDPITFSVASQLVFNAAMPIGGILFGLAFWNVAKGVNADAVKQYMIISSYGLLLLFTSNQPLGVIVPAYPPFGLITISLLGLASYLIFIGIYSSAISVANDTLLRRSIKKSVAQRSSLLATIGTAEMEKKVENSVLQITKNISEDVKEDSGVYPSLEDDDLKDYIQKAIEEVKASKKL